MLLKKGLFKAALIPKVTFYMGFGAVVLCYFIAVFLHQVQPFPHCWISDTAGFYPGFIIFRIGTISGATLMILTWFIHYFWIKQISGDLNFNIKIYRPKLFLIFGMMGAMGLMGSTANIDTGYHPKNKWHVECAGIFFIFTILASFYNTFIGGVLYYKTKKTSVCSFYAKIIYVIATIIQIYLNVVYGNSFQKNQQSLDSNIGKITQFSLTFSILFYLYLIGLDLEHFNLSYDYLDQ